MSPALPLPQLSPNYVHIFIGSVPAQIEAKYIPVLNLQQVDLNGTKVYVLPQQQQQMAANNTSLGELVKVGFGVGVGVELADLAVGAVVDGLEELFGGAKSTKAKKIKKKPVINT